MPEFCDLTSAIEWRGESWAVICRFNLEGVCFVCLAEPDEAPLDLRLGVSTADALIRAGLPLSSLDRLELSPIFAGGPALHVLRHAAGMQVSSGATARDALLLHRYPHAMSAGARTRLYQAEIIQGLTERLDQLRRDHSAAGPHAAAGAA